MGISKEMKNGACVLRIETERLDASVVDELKGLLDACLKEHDSPLVIDLSEIVFIDSKGLSLFVNLHRNRKDKEPSLCSPQPNVLKVLEISRIDKFFRIHPDLDSALADLA